MRGASEMERQSALAEDDDVHVERLEIGLRVRILVEGSETDQVVVSEQLDLFACLFEQDIFSRQRVNTKYLDLISGKFSLMRQW